MLLSRLWEQREPVYLWCFGTLRKLDFISWETVKVCIFREVQETDWIFSLAALWGKMWPHVCLSVCLSVWLSVCLSLSQMLNKRPGSSQNRKRVPLLSSGAFNRKGRETVHCFISLTRWERPFCFSLSRPLIMCLDTVYETIYVCSQVRKKVT